MDDVFEEIAASLRNDGRILADADFPVCGIIQGFNRAPTLCCRERYVDGPISWVLSPLEHLLEEDERQDPHYPGQPRGRGGSERMIFSAG